jgi:protoporphyrinogen oxidase
VVILGGGLCGVSTAFHLGGGYEIFEKDDDVGGNCRSVRKEGHTFDRTGHWLHMRNDYTKKLVEELLPGELVAVSRKAQIFTHETFLGFPFQSNTFGLPPEVNKECLLGFIQAREGRAQRPEPVNFEQWILHQYGEGIARHFMVPYNSKLYGRHPSQMTSLWCDRFVPKPSLEDVVGGAVGARPGGQLGYNVHFMYPKSGGIDHLPRALARKIPPEKLHFHSPPQALDWKNKRVHFGSKSRSYDAVVNTIPLPYLLDIMEDVPREIAEYGKTLTANTVRYLNLATRRPPKRDFHWLYVPEARFPFYRVGIYSNAIAQMAPPGHGSFYVELTSGGPEPVLKDVLPDVARGLAEIGILESADDVRFADLHKIEYAYVIYDDSYWAATAAILKWLEERQIHCRGRYGAWKYTAMEDAILEGREVAQKLSPLALASAPQTA